MAYATTHSRSLRGAISAAMQRGDHDLEAELRHELALSNIESAIGKHLDGARLTAVEVLRLRQVLDSYGPQHTA